MTTEVTLPGLGLHAQWTAGEDGWDTGMEVNLHLLNTLVQTSVQTQQNAAPGAPTSGDTYLVGAAGSGAFSGHDNAVAAYYGATWYFYAPRAGMRAWNVAATAFYYFDGSAWSAEPGTGSLTDAPSDGSTYGRNNGAWAVVSEFTNEKVDDRVAAMLTAGTNITLTYNDAGNSLTIDAAAGAPTESLVVALSDEATAITTGVAKVTFRAPYAFTLTAIKGSLSVASSSGVPTVDMNVNGSTILSTKLTIDASELTSATAAAAAVISSGAIAADDEITFDIDVAGTGATGLKVYLIGHQ